MSKVTKETPNWGTAGNGMFIGQELVPIMIPKDKLNPTNAQWFCINGQEIWVVKGQTVKVPEGVSEIWQHSYEKDNEAFEKMSKFEEQL